VSKRDSKEELYRRLERTRRMVREPLDPLTKERLTALVEDLEKQIAVIEARDADAPPDAGKPT
jgi:hypothetical protein